MINAHALAIASFRKVWSGYEYRTDADLELASVKCTKQKSRVRALMTSTVLRVERKDSIGEHLYCSK